MLKPLCILVVVVALASLVHATVSDESSALFHPTSPSPSSESSASILSSSNSLGAGAPLSSASAASPSAASASASAGSLHEQEIRNKDSSIRLFAGSRGGKLLIFENQNNMVKVEMPKTKVDPAAVEEEGLKSHAEQLKKKDAEDRLEDEKEARIKRDREQRDKQQQKTEEDAKKKQIEDAKEQAKESERKAKLEESAKEQTYKTSERQAEEQRSKKLEKEREEDEKRKQEEDQKDQAKRQEQKKKSQDEQEKKAAEFQFSYGWRHYGYEYLPATVNVVKNLCFVSGLLAGNGGQIGTLPPACRPNQGRLIFTAHKGDANSRVDVLNDGRVFHIAGGGGSWLSLSNMWFPISTERSLSLVNNWVDYGYGYRPTTLIRQDGLCVVSGLIRNGYWGQFARAPDDCIPDQAVIFSGNNHDQITRVDVNGGSIQYSGGSANYGWVNLDGIAYVPGSGGQDLALESGYQVYGGGWRPPRWTKAGNICVVSGLVRSYSFPYLISTLPDGCRPSQRLIFGCNVHVRNARIDVLPNGQVHYINGRVYDWISLDCIKFVVA